MKLSKNFNLKEFEHSVEAIRLNVDNRVPSNEIKDNIKRLVTEVLQPARDVLGGYIRINSGYRCEDVNKAVGGVYNSSHLKGQAADISCCNNKALYEVLSNMRFDQMIVYWKKGNIMWLHVSYVSKEKNRNEVIHKKL